MSKIRYDIVEHDGGWAYRVDGVFSETFPAHDMARRAAERTAAEQMVPGETTGFSYEDQPNVSSVSSTGTSRHA
jgi:hypothetical protein